MCRSIKTLRRVEPPVTDDEVRAAALQFVRKVSGYRHPSITNAAAFDGAVDDVARAVQRLLPALSGSKSPAAPATGRSSTPRAAAVGDRRGQGLVNWNGMQLFRKRGSSEVTVHFGGNGLFRGSVQGGAASLAGFKGCPLD